MLHFVELNFKPMLVVVFSIFVEWTESISRLDLRLDKLRMFREVKCGYAAEPAGIGDRYRCEMKCQCLACDQKQPSSLLSLRHMTSKASTDGL